LQLARPGEGLDLIEITANTTPPVARIMSFDKYRYLKEKEDKKQRQAQRAIRSKQIQLNARAADHERIMKVKQLEKFLEKGYPVEIQMKLRGREKGMKEWTQERLQQFLALITTEYKIITPPRPGGRGIVMQIARK
jgi:translation initiation factor IF-3